MLRAVVGTIAVFLLATAFAGAGHAERPPLPLSVIAKTAQEILLTTTLNKLPFRRGALYSLRVLHTYRGTTSSGGTVYVHHGASFCEVDGPMAGDVALVFLYAWHPVAAGFLSKNPTVDQRLSEKLRNEAVAQLGGVAPLQIGGGGRGRIRIARDRDQVVLSFYSWALQTPPSIQYESAVKGRTDPKTYGLSVSDFRPFEKELLKMLGGKSHPVTDDTWRELKSLAPQIDR